MGRFACSLSSILLLASTGPAIVLDGSFDDWSGAATLVSDPADAPQGFVDFGAVKASHDDRFVHLLIDFGREINAQGLEGTVLLLLDGDGDTATGREQHGLPGVDVIVELTPSDPERPDSPGRGVGLRSTTYQPDSMDETQRPLSPYDIGFSFAPTYAASRVEFRMERGAKLPHIPVLFDGPRFSGKLVSVDVSGEMVDETDAFTYALGSGPRRAAPLQSSDPLARAGGDLRIMCWNAKRNAFFLRSDRCVPTLRAIQPDLVLMQEVVDGVTANQLRGFFETELSTGKWGGKWEGWHAVFGPGTSGGDLHCAIGSRYPLREVEPLRLVTMPDPPDRTVRTVGAIVEIGEKRLLAVSVHLKCCGKKGGREDRIRMAEVEAIKSAIKQVTVSERIDGIVVAGDLNLVGIRNPLDVLGAGIDLDETSLEISAPLQLDRSTNATWSDAGEPFTPGRLDYLLYSDSTFEPGGSFVFDSRDLAARWRELHGLRADDSPRASDHMPLVIDLKWAGKPR
ncbi:MAG: endonuclease/exonuclease/phosphatase family protein [Phycisphaerales bacterium]|nr:MAG: endonuclease/exonuclease/phosphatase family protein [Phycisphaerales bacterium]